MQTGTASATPAATMTTAGRPVLAATSALITENATMAPIITTSPPPATITAAAPSQKKRRSEKERRSFRASVVSFRLYLPLSFAGVAAAGAAAGAIAGAAAAGAAATTGAPSGPSVVVLPALM